MEAAVQASGFSRHEEVAKDTQSDDEGQQHHRRNGQTYESPYTGAQLQERRNGEEEDRVFPLFVSDDAFLDPWGPYLELDRNPYLDAPFTKPV